MTKGRKNAYRMTGAGLGGVGIGALGARKLQKKTPRMPKGRPTAMVERHVKLAPGEKGALALGRKVSRVRNAFGARTAKAVRTFYDVLGHAPIPTVHL